jgi:hypothetical protein
MTTFKKIMKQFEKDHYDAIHFPNRKINANISELSEIITKKEEDFLMAKSIEPGLDHLFISHQ